ncbi:MAG TPA: chromosome segregation protein SMC [Acidothermaceae bacterium]|nr:chromosome segregation protein SMC [Acidothermaceae bacterium]
MYLKSLTLRGFKSFASSTTLRLEPGITCVVGPNGSGKSNVVDALAWVMGEQGAKSLRGGKMEDVIFAGTAGRPPLGRAEVSLTIDNTDGALPIEYSEVTISRIMFRSGGSEYSINGQSCRLLDVQELLSDSGIGREMHVIVGQGQLEAVLHATPEERRGFIEEAAGVLKHRKRKEKALRKLEAMQANMTRVQDLTTELRRQLGPLGKQAEVARRAAVVQADLRDSRLRLLADDLLRLQGTLQQEVADETALRERRAELDAELQEAKTREAHLESAMGSEARDLTRAQETWYRLSSVRERLRGTASIAAERQRHVRATEEETREGRDPEELANDAAAARVQQVELAAELESCRAELAAVVTARVAAEAAYEESQRHLTAALRAAADRREGLAQLAGQVAAQRSRVSASDDEIGRLTMAVDEARARSEHAQSEFHALESRIAGLDEGELNLDNDYEVAAEALATAETTLNKLRDEDREIERERASLAARAEALELGLARKDGTGALLAASQRISGLLGSVAAVVEVERGYEQAVAAALGTAADAVAVSSLDDAVAALAVLKSDDAGRAGLVVGSIGSDAAAAGPLPLLPGGARWVRDLVRGPRALDPALAALTHRVAVVENLDAALALVRALPDVRAVTRDGDVLGRDWAYGGSASTPSLLEVQAALDEARRGLADATHRAERLRFRIIGVEAELADASARADAALAQLHESDAAMAAVAEQLGQLGSAARSALAEADRMSGSIAQAQQAGDRDRETLTELEFRLAAAQGSPDEEPSTAERDRLSVVAAASRDAETEARLAVGTAEERVRAIGMQAAQLEAASAAEREARERAAVRRSRREREAVVAAAVALGAAAVLRRLELSLAAASRERDAAEHTRTVREGELLALRARERELTTDIEQLTDVVHRDELARAEQRLRIEQLEQRAMDEFGVEADALSAEYGPASLVPVFPEPDAPADAPLPDPVPFVRAEQEKRARAAERALALLGRVNPLALEEYSALEERHRFLSEQLEDLKRTRKDLMEIIREVDERVQQVFTAAYVDTAREFEGIFARLFPGGEGRLVLTDPDDMLNTGIDVEARPPGKKVKRLSLLSGGERSLTALALLVAIFKARPSPFYVMDEVEAALDDTNLRRMLGIFEELRDASQLIIITHQKPTMEIADALYGVSMRGDGVTTVISQRLREPTPA